MMDFRFQLTSCCAGPKDFLAPPNMDRKAQKVIYWQDMITRGVKILMDERQKSRETTEKWADFAIDAEEKVAKAAGDMQKDLAAAGKSALDTVFASLPKIDFAMEEHFAHEAARMQEHLKSILRSNETTYERLAADYQADLAR